MFQQGKNGRFVLASLSVAQKTLFSFKGVIAFAVLLALTPQVSASDDVQKAPTKAAVTAVKSPFLSHRVIYQMNLAKATSGASIQAASGQMFYRFQESCKEWEVETRVFLRLTHGLQDGAEDVETTWTYKSFEDFSADRFRFDVEHKHNGSLLETLAGNAWRTVRGMTATYETGHDDKSMPASALFPTAHLASVLERARQGETNFSDIVFDGASAQNPYRVNGFVVGRVMVFSDDSQSKPKIIAGSRQVPVMKSKSDAFKKASLDQLPKSPVWRVRLAYFPTENANDLPEFEIEVDFREDGVAQRIIQDFGDFQLNLTPLQFEALPPKACE
jgi:uncharacterized protein (DUF1684 family)